MQEEGKPLQYTFHGHLAESSNDKVWAIPEPDKNAARNRVDVSQTLRRALSTGGDQGIGHLVNHTCCAAHCNAEFRLTRALAGDLRAESTDEEGTIVLVVKASTDIKQHEPILVHYNPRAGIEAWKDVFKCRCYRCRGVCQPSTQGPNCEEANFQASISTVQYNGGSDARRMRVGDFVKTHEGDVWGNVVELENEVVKVRGFCTGARKLVTKPLNHAQVSTQDRKIRWKSASATIRSTALARIREHQQNFVAKGGWLEDDTVDTVMWWSLYGDTRVGGLAPRGADISRGL
jgi:hypothetical protein